MYAIRGEAVNDSYFQLVGSGGGGGKDSFGLIILSQPVNRALDQNKSEFRILISFLFLSRCF